MNRLSSQHYVDVRTYRLTDSPWFLCVVCEVHSCDVLNKQGTWKRGGNNYEETKLTKPSQPDINNFYCCFFTLIYSLSHGGGFLTLTQSKFEPDTPDGTVEFQSTLKNPENMLVKRMPIQKKKKKPGKILILRTFFLSNSKQIYGVFTACQGSRQQCKVPCWYEGQLMMHVTFPRGAAILRCIFPKLLSKPIGNIVKASFVQRKAVAAVLCCPLSVQMPPCSEETTVSLAAAVLPGASTSSSSCLLFWLLRFWLAT